MDIQRIRNGVAWRARRARRLAVRRRNAVRRAWQAERDPAHLVPSPVFVLCSARSGSTLLRSILNTHSQICAPHELHFNTARVTTPYDYAKDSWTELGLKPRDLENLLWDRAMHWMLVKSGKRIIVDKTPQNVATWRRIHGYWPQARYLHLRRHPLTVIASMADVHPERTPDEHVSWMLRYAAQLDEARAALPGPTVRYEDLVAEPAGTVSELCGYLDVRYEPAMLNYRKDTFRYGLGDWSDKINSGEIQAGRAAPDLAEAPAELQELCARWGYR
jgi:hypothetical protein